MRVTADEKLRIFYNHVPVDIAEGEELDGDFAVFLLERRAPVTPVDDEAHAHLHALTSGDEPTAGADHPPSLGVPEGTVDEIMEWVGDDPAKALRALEAETAGKARKSLIGKLEKLLEAATASDGDQAGDQADGQADGAGEDDANADNGSAAGDNDQQQPPAE